MTVKLTSVTVPDMHKDALTVRAVNARKAYERFTRAGHPHLAELLGIVEATENVAYFAELRLKLMQQLLAKEATHRPLRTEIAAAGGVTKQALDAPPYTPKHT